MASHTVIMVAPPWLAHLWWTILLCLVLLPGDYLGPLAEHLHRDCRTTRAQPVVISPLLVFEQNLGQLDDPVRFVARTPSYDLLLRQDRAQINLRFRTDGGALRQRSVSMVLLGAHPAPPVRGQSMLDGMVNCVRGNDPSRWHYGIPTFEAARYEDVYTGVDLVYYGTQQSVEFDFVVAPGVDPGAIRFALHGVDDVRLDAAGNLALQVGSAAMRFEAPVVYQELEGKQLFVDGAFALLDEGAIGFTVGAYDRRLPLVIDPKLTYATYLGGSLEERIGAIAIDGDRNIYMVGSTASGDFPATHDPWGEPGSMDILVAKISSDGRTLLYATIMGGSRVDYGVDIAVDRDGNAYICGTSSSYDLTSTPDIDESFPIVNGFQTELAGSYGQDVVVAKLNDAGTLVYSSYLGANNDRDEAAAIAVDAAGNLYVTGTVNPSMDTPRFPIRNAFQPEAGSYGVDGFVTKVNPELFGDESLIYSTYLGGTNTDTPSDIAVDGDGNAVIVGNTEAVDFPRVNALYSTRKGNTDAFVTKLLWDGLSAVFSTYIGGDQGDNAGRVTVDGEGHIYVGGSGSAGFPTTPGVYNEVGYPGVGGPVIFKLDPFGTTLEFSTYLGIYAQPQNITVDGNHNVRFPTSYYDNGAWPRAAARLSSTGATLLIDPVTGLDFTNMGYYQSFVVDEIGNVFFAFSPTRADLPTIAPLQANLRGSSDLYIGRTGKDYVRIHAIDPDPTVDLWLPYTLRPGQERQFTCWLQYALFAANRGTIELRVEDDQGNVLTSQLIQNVPAANDLYYNHRVLNKIVVPQLEQSDSLFVKAFLTPDGYAQPIDTAVIAYKIVVHQWTFMYYLNGDNDLERSALNDWDELLDVGSNDSLAIVVLLDRHPQYAWTNPDWASTRRLVPLAERRYKVLDVGELNLGDPHTLATFVNWARQEFPAEHFALVLWDHGGGWMAEQASLRNVSEPVFPLYPPGADERGGLSRDIGPDETNNDCLMSLEIKEALSKLPRLDILAMDACLNGMIENAFQYRWAADYYVSSEAVVPAAGTDNRVLLSRVKEYPDMTPEEVSRWMVQCYGSAYPSDEPEITLSSVKMSRIDRVVTEVDGLAELLLEGESWTEIDSAVSSTHWFPPDPYRDLYHFALSLKAESTDPAITLQCDRIMGTMYDCTIANHASQPEANAYGLTIYFPTCIASYDVNYHKPGNQDFAEKTLWDEFLLTYLLRKRLPPGVEGPIIDTYEINDSQSQAFGPLQPGESYFSYIPYAGDQDFYFFTTGKTTSASIRLTSPHGINYDLKLMDASGQTLAVSTVSDAVDSLSVSVLPPGAYYLEILTNSAFSEFPYRLDLVYDGSRMGAVPLSHDDGAPGGGFYSDQAGTVMGARFRAPSYPMKLEQLAFYISALDGAGSGGDGSFYVWVADVHGTKIDPFLVTPAGASLETHTGAGGWLTVDLADRDIALQVDFVVGVGYDGVNTPVLGIDSLDDGRTFVWDDAIGTWQALPLTAFIRATASYLESPDQVHFALPDTLYVLPGSALRVPIAVSTPAEVEIDSLEFTVAYDPSVLHLDSVAFGQTLLADWVVLGLDTSLTGRFGLVVRGGTPLSGDGTLMHMAFVVDEAAILGDSSLLTFEQVLADGGRVLTRTTSSQVFVGAVSHAEGERPGIPERSALYQNYPNPFNPTTTLMYDLAQAGPVRVEILDLLGRRVRTIAERQQEAGQYRVLWDATDDRGKAVAAGIYFCRLEAGPVVQVIKLALLK